SGGFVRPQPQYPRKSQRITTFVALRRLNPVKCYFNNYCRLHQPYPPMSIFLERMAFEPFGKLGQFLVRETRISLSYIEELIVLTRAPDGKGVVGQQVPPFAMADFHRRHHNIESSYGSLQLEPVAPSSPRLIRRAGAFYHQAFISAAPGKFKLVVQHSSIGEQFALRHPQRPSIRHYLAQ